MGTIFVAGCYGVGKSTLCSALSSELNIPSYSAGDLISNVNGEIYGANKAVKDKDGNQVLLAKEVQRKLETESRIILAGHFCIFNSFNYVDKLPQDVFSKISLEQILLLEADPNRILSNLANRDNKNYKLYQIEDLLREERIAAEEISRKCTCRITVHQMNFDNTDIQKCVSIISSGE